MSDKQRIELRNGIKQFVKKYKKTLKRLADK